MSSYRCYFLSRQNRIEAAENFDADGFEQAIDLALAMLAQRPQHRSIEIWQGVLRLYASRQELPRHQCHIYDGAPSQTLPTMAAIIAQKLKQNIRCLYLNSRPMVAGMKFYLASIGLDVASQIATGTLSLSSEREHLSGGQFDVDLMLFSLEKAIDDAVNDGYTGLWASGDMTWELGPQCNVGDLLDYEWRLEQIFRTRPALSGICQYHADTLPRDMVRHGLAAHRSIFVNETLARVNPHYLAPYAGTVTPHPALDEMIDDLLEEGRLPR